MNSSQRVRENLALLLVWAIIGSFAAPSAYSSRRSRAASDATSLTSAAGETISVRVAGLQAQDVVYDKNSRKLYLSVPSSVSIRGNSITPIDPVTGAIGSSYFIGSEPNKLAISDDGQALYVSLDGPAAIRRFDIPTLTPGLQFPLGADSFFGLYRANDLAVAPGNPALVAVSRYYPGTSPPEAGVAIFNNGVQATKTGPGHVNGSDFLAFSASASKLYGSGYYSGLTTMTVDSQGITVSGSTNLAQGGKIKFDNGLVFSANGQVINPETGTLLGTFAGVNSSAFVPDSSVGRVYYVQGNQFGGNGPLTLTAFDIKTFLQVGSLPIGGVSGTPVTLVRWGSNGLALQTSSNQLAIIQTSLIPSSDPVPDPTPTPSPTPSPSPATFDTFTRVVSLPTNDLVYDQATLQLYASVPSSAGSNGNSITAIDPVAGSVGNSVFIGSEPNKLALSDDGQTLYAALTGSGAVRRFDIPSQTPGLQFSLGNDNFNGPVNASDLAVMPGAPSTVAVNGSPYGSTALYDDGVRRSKTVGAAGSLAFGSASILYAGGGNIQKLTVDQNGLTLGDSIVSGGYGSIIYDHGLLYMSSGAVVDPEAKVIKGIFPNAGYGALMAVDSAQGKVFIFATSTQTPTLTAYDINTFLPLGSITLQVGFGGLAGPTSLVRWGVNGLAFRTNNKVYLVQSTLVNSSQAVPSATPVPSPTPSPTPAYIPTDVRKVALPANDLVYDENSQKLYASVPSSAGQNGNSITPIDPVSGTLGASVFVGSEPNRLAQSDDGKTLYVALDGASAIRRFDIPTQTPGFQFAPKSPFQKPVDMAVLPGSPQSIALASGYNGVAIYDNGNARPNSTNGGAYAIDRIAFGASANTLYGCDTESSGFEFVKLAVDSTGVKSSNLVNGLVAGFGGNIKFVNGLLYSSGGRVVDPEGQKLVGTFNTGGSAFTVDAALGRIFFVSNPGLGVTVSAYDLKTFLPIGSTTVQNVTGSPTSLVRWGTNGLAFRTSANPGSSTNDSAVYLLQTALVSTAAPVPSSVQFSVANYSVFEGNGNATITVTRTGDISGTSTVDYATSDGTATERTSYTAASGTLTFAPGELSKTFTVLITDNAIQDGNRTVNLTLSNVSGAVLGTPNPALLTIQDNDFGTTNTNPIDQAQFFVNQQYADFLNRAPDVAGLSYWTSGIFRCGTDTQCLHDRRVATADAFFFEPEFQDTGGYVYRIYKAAFGNQPSYAQFSPDRARVVGGASLDQSKTAFARSFVKRPAFTAQYPAILTGSDFVDAELQTIQAKLGLDLSANRADIINAYQSGGADQDLSRGLALRRIADMQALIDSQYNESFVVMEYFGYLRRDPDPAGENFWLGQVNKYPLRNVDIQHAMACSFITSDEYQKRFSLAVTHHNTECPQ